MSYVRYYNGNLQADGVFCQWDGVSCHTMLVTVSGGNLYAVDESIQPPSTCSGRSNVVVYSSGNLMTTNVSSMPCSAI